MNEKVKVKKSKKDRLYPWAWSTRAASCTVQFVLMMQATYYAMQGIGLSAEVVGLIFLVSKIFDGVTDLIAGYIIDKTHSKLGKARPYELFIIPMWILTVVFFSTPASMGYTGKVIWVFVLYSLINAVCITFLDASETTYLARSTTDDTLRAKALSISGLFSMLAPTAASIILPQLIANWGSEPGGWTKIMLVFAVPMTILGIIRFVCIKEINVDDSVGAMQKDNLSLKDSVYAIFHNKYLWILVGANFFCTLINGLGSAVGTFFFEFIIGDIGKMSILSVLSMLSPFVMLLLPKVVAKGQATNFVRIGLILGIIGNVVKFLAGSNFTIFMVGSVLTVFPGITTIQFIASLFLIQCYDYGELKTGFRPESMLNAVNCFGKKVGAGLASALAGMVLGMAGFVSGSATQSATALNTIRIMTTIVPGVLCLLMIFVLAFYDLEKKQNQIREELVVKKAESK